MQNLSAIWISTVPLVPVELEFCCRLQTFWGPRILDASWYSRHASLCFDSASLPCFSIPIVVENEKIGLSRWEWSINWRIDWIVFAQNNSHMIFSFQDRPSARCAWYDNWQRSLCFSVCDVFVSYAQFRNESNHAISASDSDLAPRSIPIHRH